MRFIIGHHSGHRVPHLGLVAQIEEAIMGKLEGQHVSGVLHKNLLPHIAGFGQSSASQAHGILDIITELQVIHRKDVKCYIAIGWGLYTVGQQQLNKINSTQHNTNVKLDEDSCSHYRQHPGSAKALHHYTACTDHSQ